MKILIIDDHKIFCHGLRLILSQREDRPTVLMAESVALGLELTAENPDLDLILLDINLPDMDGHEALKVFSDRFQTLPVIMLTASESRHNMRRCFDAGASGYIPKSSSAELMLGAIQLVLAGGVYVPPSLTISQRLPQTAKHRAIELDSLGKLTDRQGEVLFHLQDGISNKQIAERLSLSEATVKVHVSAILKALGLRSRVEAALIAQKLNWQSG